MAETCRTEIFYWGDLPGPNVSTYLELRKVQLLQSSLYFYVAH